MSKIMSAIQIINETFEYYTEKVGRRAVHRYKDGEADTCMYNGDLGTHCAIGRCLLSVYQDGGYDLIGNEDAISGLVESNELLDLDEMLQPQYRGHHIQFWDKLQTFHDDVCNWDSEGKVTSEGIKYIDNFIKSESDGYGQ